MRNRYTASEMAAIAIRNSIVSGELAPGRHLNQDELANTYGVSRVPIREALRYLESDGLITLIPHRGAEVAALSVEDLVDIYTVRISLEGVAAELGVRNLEGDDVTRMEQLLRALCETSDWSDWANLDGEFHFTLYNACRRPRLLRVVTNFWDLGLRYRTVHMMLPGIPDHVRAEHRAIYEACQRMDPDATKKATTDCLRRARDTLVDYFERCYGRGPNARLAMASAKLSCGE